MVIQLKKPRDDKSIMKHLNNILQPSVGLSVQNTSNIELVQELVHVVTEQEKLEKSATGATSLRIQYA